MHRSISVAPIYIYIIYSGMFAAAVSPTVSHHYNMYNIMITTGYIFAVLNPLVPLKPAG